MCDKLADCTVMRAWFRKGVDKPTVLLIPYKGAELIAGGIKITSNIAPRVHHTLGQEEAHNFYTISREVINGLNRGGLSWSRDTFDAVD